MNHSNRIPTDTVDQDEASLVGAQMVVFSSGNWLSREAFQELATPIPLPRHRVLQTPSAHHDRARGPRAGHRNLRDTAETHAARLARVARTLNLFGQRHHVVEQASVSQRGWAIPV